MFTGLIECTGELVDRTASGHAGKLTVRPSVRFSDPVPGESIAVNGVCLTLEREDAQGRLVFHTLAETLAKTNLGLLPRGGSLNLERAMRLGDRVGGHLVSGHVDCTGTVERCERDGEDFALAIAYPKSFAPLLVPQGSVAVDGVSLTVARLEAGVFEVRLIPVTLGGTALAKRTAGMRVNLEGDLIGKYVQRHFAVAETPGSGGSVTMDTLREAGFF